MSQPTRKTGSLKTTVQFYVQLLQGVGSILALVAGGVWVYMQGYFDRNGEIEHTVEVHQYDASHNFVRVGVAIRNTGLLPFDLPSARVRFHVIERGQGSDQVSRPGSVYLFPFSDEVFEEKTGRVMPRTTEVLRAEFFVDACIPLALISTTVCAEQARCFDGQGETAEQVWLDSSVVELQPKAGAACD